MLKLYQMRWGSVCTYPEIYMVGVLECGGSYAVQMESGVSQPKKWRGEGSNTPSPSGIKQLAGTELVGNHQGN